MVAAKVLWAWASSTWFWWNFYCFLSSSIREWTFSEMVETTTFSFSLLKQEGNVNLCWNKQEPANPKHTKKAVLSWDFSSFFEPLPVLDGRPKMNRDQSQFELCVCGLFVLSCQAELTEFRRQVLLCCSASKLLKLSSEEDKWQETFKKTKNKAKQKTTFATDCVFFTWNSEFSGCLFAVLAQSSTTWNWHRRQNKPREQKINLFTSPHPLQMHKRLKTGNSCGDSLSASTAGNLGFAVLTGNEVQRTECAVTQEEEKGEQGDRRRGHSLWAEVTGLIPLNTREVVEDGNTLCHSALQQGTLTAGACSCRAAAPWSVIWVCVTVCVCVWKWWQQTKQKIVFENEFK